MALQLNLLKLKPSSMADLSRDVLQAPTICLVWLQTIFFYASVIRLFLLASLLKATITLVVAGGKCNTWAISSGKDGFVTTWCYFKNVRNVQVDDVVLVVDSSVPRGSWVLGRVTEVYPDKNGLVRNVSIRTKSSTLVRPIVKLVMVLECDE